MGIVFDCFWSEFNRYLYSLTRPVNLGNTALGEKNPVMGALRWYHRSEFEGEANPEIAELYRPLIEKYFTYPDPRQDLAYLWKKITGEKNLVALEVN